LPLPVPTVRDLMVSPPITVEASTMLLDAALTFRSSSIRHLPVLQDGKLVGLLTDRDIQRCAPSRLIPVTEDIYNGVFAGNTVERVMTREPRTVPPDLSLTEAISQMQQARYGCLLVMEQDQLVGILTRSDLVDALQRLLSGQSINRPQES
jgi:acetoin utilization protein AcuB